MLQDYSNLNLKAGAKPRCSKAGFKFIRESPESVLTGVLNCMAFKFGKLKLSRQLERFLFYNNFVYNTIDYYRELHRHNFPNLYCLGDDVFQRRSSRGINLSDLPSRLFRDVHMPRDRALLCAL